MRAPGDCEVPGANVEPAPTNAKRAPTEQAQIAHSAADRSQRSPHPTRRLACLTRVGLR